MGAGWGYFEDSGPEWRRLREAADLERARQRALVDVSGLDAPQKRRLWAHLQRHRPELAKTLQDPNLRALREMFDASLHLPGEWVEEALGD